MFVCREIAQQIPIKSAIICWLGFLRHPSMADVFRVIGSWFGVVGGGGGECRLFHGRRLRDGRRHNIGFAADRGCAVAGNIVPWIGVDAHLAV